MKGVRRISIIGNSAAGKSTRMGNALGLEVYSVDKIYWLPGWQLRALQSYRSLHEQWLGKDAWIIEGVGYWEEMVQRLHLSELVVFLDVPVELCKERAAMRIEREQHAPNPDITQGCRYGAVNDLQMETIERFHLELRPRILECLSMMDAEKVRHIRACSELSSSSGGIVFDDPM